MDTNKNHVNVKEMNFDQLFKRKFICKQQRNKYLKK
jgi:hypothetical protein